jgi:glutathione synthase/RimK-type ligase-like ATP-grasp enzyme
MKYLIIDKRQRVKTEGEFPHASSRIMEELKKKNFDFDFCYIDEIEIFLKNSTLEIFIKEKNILEYTHLLFRGHTLGQNTEYETKQLITHYIVQFNIDNPSNKIHVLNSDAIVNLPFYNKIWFGYICTQNNIPYFDSYYRLDGQYTMKRSFLQNYPLILKEYTGQNATRKIDGELKIKKNVYKLEGPQDYKTEFLKEKNLKNFFIQEYSDTGEDFRIFLSKGMIVGGWKRKATDGFITVSKGEYTIYNEPNEEMTQMAKKVAKAFKADFIAADFMYKDNKLYLQEISLHPGFKAYEQKATGGQPANIAKAIIESF